MSRYAHITTGPNNPPEPTCHECDVVLDVDGDDGACNYTGRACAPGGCDCGTQRTIYCTSCERELAESEPRDPDDNHLSTWDRATRSLPRRLARVDEPGHHGTDPNWSTYV